MANERIIFSERIEGISREAHDWLRKVLQYEVDEEDPSGLFELLGIEDDGEDLANWPDFTWRISTPSSWHKDEPSEGPKVGAILWLQSTENCHVGHVYAVVQALIEKFMPDFVFSLSAAISSDKMHVRDFGGAWAVITKDYTRTGNTWQAIEDVEDGHYAMSDHLDHVDSLEVVENENGAVFVECTKCGKNVRLLV